MGVRRLNTTTSTHEATGFTFTNGFQFGLGFGLGTAALYAAYILLFNIIGSTIL